MKFQSLEAFRGLAAIMVVLFHSLFYSTLNPNFLVLHSDLFVDFFFVLSGFVMSFAYQDKIKLSLSFKQFIMIRLFRLYPLHLFTLLIWLPYVLMQIYAYQHGMGSTNPSEKQNIYSFVLNLLFLQSFAPAGGAGWNWPSWSIAVEFFLYILFFYYVQLKTKNTWLPALFLVLIALTFLYQVDDPLRTDWVAFLRGIGGFFLGFILYQFYLKVQISIQNTAMATILESLVVLFMLYSVSHYSLNHKNIYFLSIITFMLLIYVFAIQNKGYISQLLQTKLFQLFGRLSFSIYLVHGLILAVSSNIAVYIFKLPKITILERKEAIVLNYGILINIFLLFFIILIANYTYKYIEAPWMLKAKRLWGQRSS